MGFVRLEKKNGGLGRFDGFEKIDAFELINLDFLDFLESLANGCGNY